ncbi:MAG: transposase [Thermomonas sp.]
MGHPRRCLVARQRFSAEFKREAVRLLEQGDKPVTQLALELGIARNLLYKWRDALAVRASMLFVALLDARRSSRNWHSCVGTGRGCNKRTRS